MQTTLIRYIEDKNINGFEGKVFLITDFAHTDPKYALAVAYASSLEDRNELIELPAKYEYAFLGFFRAKIDKLREINRKFIFVIDLTPFPYIICYINDTDDAIIIDDSKFSQDMQALWNDYCSEKVITIVVNLYPPHSGLKHIKY